MANGKVGRPKLSPEDKELKRFPTKSGKATRSQLKVYGSGKRTELDKEKDTWYVVGELARGRTYQDIADELNQKNPDYNLNKTTLWRDVEKTLVEWKRENMENIDAFIAKELARLEEIERIVMRDYQKSKTLRPNEYASLMKRGLTVEEIDEIYKESGRELAGDPRYLETMLHLQKQRMDLLGLGKGNDVAQNTIVQYNFGDTNIEDLAKIADALQDNKFNEVDEQ